jgi:hypothetical protein
LQLILRFQGKDELACIAKLRINDMAVGLKGVSSMFAIALSVVAVSGGVAIAQDADQAQTISEAIEAEFFDESGTYFENRETDENLRRWLFGAPYPENGIEADAEDVHTIYVEALEQQVSSTPPIRTPDLENPYSSSLLLQPDIAPARVTGTEFVPPAPTAVPVPPPAVVPPPQPRALY